jgi:hypothetical protein
MHTLLKEFKSARVKKVTKSVLFLLITYLTGISCKDSSDPSPDVYAYLPLQVGSYITYDVKEEIYSADQEEPMVSSWQQKNQVESLHATGDDVSEFIVATYKRISDTEHWQKVSENSVKRFPDKILTTSNNKILLSLVFPIDTRVQWNGNVYNNQEEEKYHYENINSADTVSGQLFEHTVTVVERMDSSVINKYTGIKKYALGVGLIFDEQISFEYCQTEECLQNDLRKVESGYRIVRVIKGSGKNI